MTLHIAKTLLDVPSADPDDARRRRLFNILLMWVLVFTLFASIVSIVGDVAGIEWIGRGEGRLHTYSTPLVALVVVAVLFAINRYGPRWLASLLFLLFLFVIVIFSDEPTSIVNGRGLLSLAIPIVMANVLLPPYTSLIMAGLSSLVVIVIAPSLEVVPNPFTIAAFFLIALVSWFGARNLEHALKDLRALNQEQDQYIAERTRDLKRRSIQLQTASEVARDATAILDIDQLLKETAHLISDRFGFYHAGIFLLDERGEYAVLRATSSEGGQRMLAQGHRLAVGKVGIVGHVAGTGKPRIALDVGKDAFHFDNPDLPATRSELALPLAGRGQVIGVLDVQSVQEAGFSEEDVATLQTMADQLANAIGNARLYEQAQQEIAERKQIEEALARQTQILDAELEQFAHVAAHDLQEPLRMIVSYSQLLARRYKDKLGPDADEFIAYAVDGANRIKSLINALLTYSRVTTRGRPFIPTDCSALLDRILANLRLAIEKSGAVVTCEPLPTVMADSSQLMQVFQNLIINAIQFRSDAPLEIRVGVEHTDGGWMFAVHDNGIGIEPQYLERIFALFEQLHSREKYPGTGVGLALCKKIVERHGGHIWAESEPGRGSTFCFTIPDREA